ncbi:peptidase S24-like protein [Motilibacter rhizosphaerae]|uniref:Peptidase S24-like protein n=1 Tax=Motilibacter rhizosphaerae TaxID=598652 RepID=A0A4Q7NPM4_9ACTN|nr:S24 family peptidase [Motilibacter rhizosphaerae]RZS87133.1 peptidase S24-like protein [Motilibacter rhizosphaerae]
MGWLRAVVEGRSMLPRLRPGDRLLVRTGREPRPGRAVVVRLPDRPLAVKRAGVRDADGWWVESENPAEGTDSWTIGRPVPPGDVLGVVVLRYRPLRSFGRM